jgi:hypothetical protein
MAAAAAAAGTSMATATAVPDVAKRLAHDRQGCQNFIKGYQGQDEGAGAAARYKRYLYCRQSAQLDEDRAVNIDAVSEGQRENEDAAIDCC